MMVVSRGGWLTGRQVRGRSVRLTVDAVQNVVKAGHPRFLVEAAAQLGWQDVQQSSVHRLNTTTLHHSMVDFTRSSAIAELTRDAPGLSKSCQLLHTVREIAFEKAGNR